MAHISLRRFALFFWSSGESVLGLFSDSLSPFALRVCRSIGAKANTVACSCVAWSPAFPRHPLMESTRVHIALEHVQRLQPLGAKQAVMAKYTEVLWFAHDLLSFMVNEQAQEARHQSDGVPMKDSVQSFNAEGARRDDSLRQGHKVV